MQWMTKCKCYENLKKVSDVWGWEFTRILKVDDMQQQKIVHMLRWWYEDHTLKQDTKIVNPMNAARTAQAQLQYYLSNSTSSSRAIIRNIFEQDNMFFGGDQCTHTTLFIQVLCLTPFAQRQCFGEYLAHILNMFITAAVPMTICIITANKTVMQ